MGGLLVYAARCETVSIGGKSEGFMKRIIVAVAVTVLAVAGIVGRSEAQPIPPAPAGGPQWTPAQLDRASPLHEYAAWDLTAHVDLGVGEFQGHRASSASQNTTRALAAIGKLRWQRRAAQPLAPFVEFGFGLAGFSETTIGGVRHLGGDFEFTEVLRTGVRFGSHLQYEIGVAGQHFSNAGLFPPNEGITYVSLSGAWYFR